MDIIYAADLAGMQLSSKFNKGIRFSFCVVHMHGLFL